MATLEVRYGITFSFAKGGKVSIKDVKDEKDELITDKLVRTYMWIMVIVVALFLIAGAFTEVTG